MDNNGYRPQRRRPALDPQRANGARSRSNHTKAGAQKSYDTYVTFALDARARGDLVEMENCYQHAEHFFRVISNRTS